MKNTGRSSITDADDQPILSGAARLSVCAGIIILVMISVLLWAGFGAEVFVEVATTAWRNCF